MLPTTDQPFQIAGFELFTCENLLDRRQLQDHTQYPSHGAVAPQDLVIENQVLQFAALNGHDDRPVCAIQWRKYTLRTRLQGKTVVLVATADTNAATQAELFIQPGNFHPGLVWIMG